jgi:hypothetical protein
VPNIQLIEPRERVTIVTPLGIRFWDPALDMPIDSGLTVIARPRDSGDPATRAYLTGAGVYAFQGLPGLHALEYPTADVYGASPPTPRRFIIEVSDAQRRYLPAVFGVDVPYWGIFPTGIASSPLGGVLPGFYLFSAPTRPATPSLAAVRAQLDEYVDAATRRPAAYAVLEVMAPGQATWFGVADARGCVAVLFPYPTFTGASGGMSPLAATSGLMEQRWSVTIRARYAPDALTVPSGSSTPDLRSIFNQSPALIWSTLVDLGVPPDQELSSVVTFGQELVLRTDTGPTLVIEPFVSPL